MHKTNSWLLAFFLGCIVALALLATDKSAWAVDPIFMPVVHKDSAGPTVDPTLTATPTQATDGATATPTPPAETATPTATTSSAGTATATATADGKPIVADLYVDDDNTTGVENGDTQSPYNTLQEAIAAAVDGKTIAVAAGTYAENIRVQDKTLHLFGGYMGASAADYAAGNGGNFSVRNQAANVSHIQGDGADSVVTLLNAGASTIDGFRITGGTRSLEPEFGILGGGLYVSGGSPTISNNLIENNDTRPPTPGDSEPVGGGIFAGDADIFILNNIIRNNTSGRGGGIGINGGSVVIRGNTVQNNMGVSDHGGGLYIAAPQVEVSDNLIRGNEIGRELGYGWGGGIIVFGADSRALLSFNIITENYAPSVGSGVFIDDGARATLDHELIYNNACPDGGTTGGVGVYVDGYDQAGSQATLIHTTVAGHACTTMGGNGLYVEAGSEVTIQNSIFWGNGGDDFFVDATSRITATYTLAQEALAGEGNLSVDPLFADPGQHDYHLQSTAGRWDPQANGGSGGVVVDANQSPAIDAAHPASPFANEPSPNGNRANMGVYGNTAEASNSSP